MRRVLIIVAVGTLLTGCAASAPTSTPTSTPVDPSAHSTREWASQIAQIRSQYDDWAAQWKAHACRPSAFDKSPCSGDLATAAMTADAIQAALQGIDSTNRLGAPPAEIADLVSATVAAADKAQKIGDGYNASCPANPEPPQCVGSAFRFVKSLDELGAQFAGWSPYL